MTAGTVPMGALAARLIIQPSSVRRLLWALPVLLLISTYYVFLASAGHFHDLDSQLDYYDQMCEGFRHGHLYIQEAPAPELLAKRDPYAPQNFDLWLWDAALYNGHYYMYWGPVPGLLLLAWKTLIGSAARITDQWPTTFFMLGRLYAGAALVLSIASRVRIRQPPWISSLAIAVFGLANPAAFIVARPHVYEAALAGGQCYLFWGLVFAFWGLENARSRRWLFALASAAWGLSVGCRATMFVPVPILIAITACFAGYASKPHFKRWVLDCLALGAPFAFGAAAYGVYNYLRFDSAFEFGVHYQVTLQPFTGNSSYVWPNVFSYLFAPVEWSCRFPFVRLLGDRPLSHWLTWPPGYLSFERVGGIMYTATWCWLLPLSVARVIAHVRGLRRPLTLPSSPSMTRQELWSVLCSLAVMLSVVPVLWLWEASMRYAGDAVGGIVFASTVGVFWLLQKSYCARRRGFGLAVRGLITALGLQTVVVGALCAMTSSNDPLKTLNPVLYEQLEQHLSLCRDSR